MSEAEEHVCNGHDEVTTDTPSLVHKLMENGHLPIPTKTEIHEVQDGVDDLKRAIDLALDYLNASANEDVEGDNLLVAKWQNCNGAYHDPDDTTTDETWQLSEKLEECLVDIRSLGIENNSRAGL